MSKAMLAVVFVSLLASFSHGGYHELIDEGCGETEAGRLSQSIEGARDIAQNCLVRDNLNPALGKKIVDIVDNGKVHFSCADFKENAPLAYTSVSDITTVTWPPIEFVFLRFDQSEFNLFHELIHVADPEDRLTFGMDFHNMGFFPDAVYGCQAACNNFVRGKNLFRQRISILEMTAKKEIPRLDWWPCQNLDKAECEMLRKLAWLCHNNGPFLNKYINSGGKLYGLASCFAAVMTRCNDSACQNWIEGVEEDMDITNPVLRASSRGDPVLAFRMAELYYFRGWDALEELPRAEKRVAQALKREGLLQKCVSDPLWFRYQD